MSKAKKKTEKTKQIQPKERYLTDERVKEIALGLVNGQWFCSDQLGERDAHLLHAVFAPIIFLKEETIDEWKRDGVIHLAAPMNSAIGGRSINGHPIFGEVMPLTKQDYQNVRAIEKKLNDSMKKALE